MPERTELGVSAMHRGLPQQRTQRTKILLVDLGASMGGVESYLEALAAILSTHAELHALCVLPELAARLGRHGVRVTLLPAFRGARLLRFLSALVLAPALMVRYRIDVIQINGLLESVLMLPARLLGRRAVYTRHGPFELDVFPWYRRPLKFLPRLIARYTAHAATTLVCVSETVGAGCRTQFAEERIRVIPNWVSRLPAPVDRFARSPERPVEIIYVGRLEQYKGLHLLLEALRGIAGVRLTVVGDGSYGRALRTQAAGLDVEFVGFQPETQPFYDRADLFIMPSLGPEGLPMVTIEAMACGLPCLFSDLPVHSEITDQGRAALLFRSGDAADLRAKLLSLLTNVAERRRLAERAYRRVEQRYHASAATQAYLQLFA